MAFFNSANYSPSGRIANDSSDMMANAGRVVGFKHIPSGKSVYFKAFITTFNDAYSSNWNAEEVFGRADPIYSFKNTTRRITISFKVPAFTEGEAYENLGKVQQLIQFLYPAYTDVDSANTIAQSPLIRLSFMNLVRKSEASNSGSTQAKRATIYEDYTWINDPDNGLLGAIMSLSVNHNLESPNAGIIEKAGKDRLVTILPTHIDVNLEFAPIHEHGLGWNLNKDFGNGESFPYGAPLNEESLGTVDVSSAAERAIIESAVERAGVQAAIDQQLAEQRELMTSVISRINADPPPLSEPPSRRDARRASRAARRAGRQDD